MSRSRIQLAGFEDLLLWPHAKSDSSGAIRKWYKANKLVWLQRGGVLTFSIAPLCRSQRLAGTNYNFSRAPKHGLKNPLDGRRSWGVLQSLRNRYCRAEAANFPIGNAKNVPGFKKTKGSADNLWKMRPILENVGGERMR